MVCLFVFFAILVRALTCSSKSARKTVFGHLNKPSWLFWPSKLQSVQNSLFFSEISAGFKVIPLKLSHYQNFF